MTRTILGVLIGAVLGFLSAMIVFVLMSDVVARFENWKDSRKREKDGRKDEDG